jgi:hypothetical protein
VGKKQRKTGEGGELPHCDIALVQGAKSRQGVESGCQTDRLIWWGRAGRLRVIACLIGCSGGKTSLLSGEEGSGKISILVCFLRSLDERGDT